MTSSTATEPRLLGVDDLDALVTLETIAHLGGWTEEAILLELVHADAHVYGVDDDDDNDNDDDASGGPLVAWAALRLIVDEVWVLNIATHPDHRRHGHADRLLERAARTTWPAPAKVPTSLWLEVRESNDGARALYERHGFVVVGRRPGYYPPLPGSTSDTRETAILMRAVR